jgi:chromosome segregation ATPase
MSESLSSDVMNEAEQLMKSLETRMNSLETKVTQDTKKKPSGNQAGTTAATTTSNNNSEAVEAALKAYQKQILGKLKQIRESFDAEGGDIQTIRSERDKLAAENKQMKTEIERLNYRVNHLVKALNEEEAKHAAK